MKIGRVVGRQAIADIELLRADGTVAVASAVIDTGYNGAVTLPPQTARSLKLPFLGLRSGHLADGTTVTTTTRRGRIRWMGTFKDGLVAEIGATPLIGMALISGCRLTIDAVNGGDVTIEVLASPS
jgi:clan AA aspartic protease